MSVTVEKFSRMTDDLLIYGGSSSQTATTMQQMQDYMVLQANTVGNLVDSLLWQPTTTYTAGAVIHSPNMPAGYVATATSETGQTGSNEPAWDVNYSSYTDGTVTWSIHKELVEEQIATHNAAADAHSTLFAAKQDKLADTVDYVVDSYSDDDGNWYRKYKSGWVEQGGIIPAATSTNRKVYNLITPFANTNYTIHINLRYNKNTEASYGYINAADLTTSTFSANEDNGYERDWYACGQGATE